MGVENMKLTIWPYSLHPTQYPWQHEKWNKTFDHAA
jgi:ubiquinol-cytochrome c reductase cytochrome c1 subunit